MGADAFAAGCAFSTEFIEKRPDVAKRFAGAWAKAIEYINKEPEKARKYLAKNTLTPDDLVDSVPMLGYIMVKDMNAFGEDVASETMKRVSGEFRTYADDPTFILCESLV